ncbi:SulP family inorganic anion transporter [Varunaivibrio sulfuroxidans]|uniref:SulP family sulfate permease n=1 Tax=Varunaivibrio sulfuroxidans TaxID=1773489 RepID=A0A4R3J9V3_9PROT|nr:sulfate permease [Varunaivibrio sulfuroxidans]TCS61370.1 SulP family sulfate permease [Varunaivibrio sulfuroxidans]WES31018.1 sulfate permease [Varunaivibrio sulfuroxidans]
MNQSYSGHASPWRLFVPKMYTVLREGYRLGDLKSDVLAGLTVAIVALPLSMALAIASGATPQQGLFTAIVGGFMISFFGGSRFQIGGPTGAFVVVVFNVIHQYGYGGLAQATVIAGIILIIFGLARLGAYIKYIPYPVVTGFTSGIAVIIFSSQVKDLLGLRLADVPAEFIAKWDAFYHAAATAQAAPIAISAGCLALIVATRRYAPKLPAFLIAVIAGALAVWVWGLNVETIGSKFGALPQTLPTPSWPTFTFARVRELLPTAFTIAFLAGIESLLSAVVADGMTGRRHRSNCELVAQGMANIGSVLFGGIPATGAIARTATNIRSGGRTPVAGVAHALFILLFVLFLSPLASYIPLASLAAVLVVVAWNMSEFEHFKSLMKSPAGDRVVLITTFLLTVLVDLTVAIGVGVVLAAILFVHRMALAVEVETKTKLLAEDVDDLSAPRLAPYQGPPDLPETIEVYQINGPFFFGAATLLSDVLDRLRHPPRVMIVRMGNVPMIDASGAAALTAFIDKCRKQNTIVLLSNLKTQPRRLIEKMCAKDIERGDVRLAENYADARAQALAYVADGK